MGLSPLHRPEINTTYISVSTFILVPEKLQILLVPAITVLFLEVDLHFFIKNCEANPCVIFVRIFFHLTSAFFRRNGKTLED